MTTLMPGASRPINASDPAWIRSLRDDAASKFIERGYPTIRDESWRYTSLADVAATPWTIVSGAAEAPESERVIPIECSCRIDLVNGAVASVENGEDSAIVVCSLREAAGDPAESAHLQAHMGRIARGDADDALAMLNTSTLSDGLYIRIGRGVSLSRPILIVHQTAPGASGPVAVHPRTLVVVEDGASVTLVEHVLGAEDDARTFTNAIAEFHIGDAARCDHTLIQDEPQGAVHVNTRRATLGRDAHFGSHALILGGRLTRNGIATYLNGEGGHTILTGVYLCRDGQHCDTAIRVDHAKPNCFSRQFYRGLADEAGRGVFTGRIVVHLDAQKTDAIQSSSGLLLAPTAQITSRPQLEIYADDVRCTHGSTIGQIDEDAVFYLRARGIPEAEARSLLVRAFIADIIDRFPDAPVRTWALDRLAAWLEAGSAARTGS